MGQQHGGYSRLSFLYYSLCRVVSTVTLAYTMYVYEGKPFGVNGINLLPGATHISVTFSVPSLLSDNTTYDVTFPPFRTLTMSDGVNIIPVGGGTFLSFTFITTNGAGDITSWAIDELIGAGRTFVLGDQCCTIGDPPFLSTYCCSGPTDASIQTNGFSGIGRELTLHTTMVRRVCGQFRNHQPGRCCC